MKEVKKKTKDYRSHTIPPHKMNEINDYSEYVCALICGNNNYTNKEENKNKN